MYLEFVVADSEEDVQPIAHFLYHGITFTLGESFHFLPVLLEVSEKIDEVDGVDLYRFIGDREPFLTEVGFNAVLDRYFWHLSQKRVNRGDDIAYMIKEVAEIFNRQLFAINYMNRALPDSGFWPLRRSHIIKEQDWLRKRFAELGLIKKGVDENAEQIR